MLFQAQLEENRGNSRDIRVKPSYWWVFSPSSFVVLAKIILVIGIWTVAAGQV